MDIRKEVVSHRNKINNLSRLDATKSVSKKAASLLLILGKVEEENKQFAADCWFGTSSNQKFTFADLVSTLETIKA